MKKLFIFSALICSTLLTAQSNKVVSLYSGYGKTSDTLTNTTANTLTVSLSSKYTNIAVQPVLTKISGTIASTITVQGSLDGTNYVNITNTGDTLMATDQTTNTKVMLIDNPAYTYIRLSGVGTGTMSASLKGYVQVSPIAGNSPATANLTSNYGNTIDTVTNTATNYVTKQVTGSYTKVVIQPVVTKISGTVAGTVTLQGSIDGTNYVTVNTSYLLGGSATMSCANQTTNTKLFVVTGSPYQYYRLSYTGSGTMSAKLRGYLSGK